jgi:hypothetical protein
MNSMVATKLLSIVLCGKNDNYLGNFIYRITTCLNYLSQNIKAIGRENDIEILVTDWGSDIPLSNALFLSKECSEITRFIYVPPNICAIFNTDGQSFNAHSSMNTAIRRSLGMYIMFMPADVLIPSISIQNLLMLLEGDLDSCFPPSKAMLNIGRKRIPWQVVSKEPTPHELERYIQLHNRHMIYENDFPGLIGGYGAMILHRDIWYECDGLIEDRAGHGYTDVELGLRISQRYPCIDLGCFGICVYDMEQKTDLWSKVKELEPPRIRRSINLDNRDWGLANYKFEIQKSSLNKEASCESSSTSPAKKMFFATDKLLTFDQVRKFLKMRGNLLNIWWKKDEVKLVRHSSEWAALNALAWYTLNFLPMKYLEFDVHQGYTVSVASSINKGLEIYAIDEWDRSDNDPDKHPIWFPSSLLHANNFQGYIRFVTGDKFTALERLKESFIGNMLFDLILFRCDMFGHASLDQIDMLEGHISDNGGLIITAIDPSLFADALQYATKKYPSYLRIDCCEYNTAIFLNTDNSLEEERAKLESLKYNLHKEWKTDWFFIYSTYLVSRIISKSVSLAKKKLQPKKLDG